MIGVDHRGARRIAQDCSLFVAAQGLDRLRIGSVIAGKAMGDDAGGPGNGDHVAACEIAGNGGHAGGKQAGATRDGGSYNDRMGAVACWNALMDENTYMVQKWNEFVAA